MNSGIIRSASCDKYTRDGKWRCDNTTMHQCVTVIFTQWKATPTAQISFLTIDSLWLDYDSWLSLVQFAFSIMGPFTVCHQDENNENKRRKNKQRKEERKEEDEKEKQQQRQKQLPTQQMKGPKK